MARVQSGQAGEGIKLFGTMIMLYGRERKEDKKSSEDEGTEEKRLDKIIPCPRCKSMETKFCYFNNYNVNQPRHFCKGCQRYWTAGGALRNVPVGAGRRKVKPPCHDTSGFLESGFVSTVQQEFRLDKGWNEWHVGTMHMAQEDFRQFFPSKKRSISSVVERHPC